MKWSRLKQWPCLKSLVTDQCRMNSTRTWSTFEVNPAACRAIYGFPQQHLRMGERKPASHRPLFLILTLLNPHIFHPQTLHPQSFAHILVTHKLFTHRLFKHILFSYRLATHILSPTDLAHNCFTHILFAHGLFTHRLFTHKHFSHRLPPYMFLRPNAFHP